MNSKTISFSDGWVQKFMRRHGLSIRRRTTEAQKNRSQLIDKLRAVVKVRKLCQRVNYDMEDIIAMDEPAVWNDMIANTTVEKRGAHTVSLKTTGHEKAKITVCLTACANGDKKKPFFVFKGAKREVKRLNEAFRTQCVVATSASGWMTEKLTEQYIREVLGVFTFGKRRPLAWDSFRCHLTDGVKGLLSKGLIDPVIVPDGCAKFIQAPDVSWNKLMKELLCESYDSWLAGDDHQLTPQGNMRPPSRRAMIEWILSAWKKLPRELIQKSFVSCALSTKLDGTEDGSIACIKHEPCQDLLQRLQNYEWNEENVNPFENIPDEDKEMEDIAELQIDQEEGTEDTEVVVD